MLLILKDYEKTILSLTYAVENNNNRIGDRFRYVIERYKPILFSPLFSARVILMHPSHPPTQSWNSNLNNTKLIHFTLNKLKTYIAERKQY